MNNTASVGELFLQLFRSNAKIQRWPGRSDELYQVRLLDGSKYVIYKRVGADYPLTWFIVKTEGFTRRSKILSGGTEIHRFNIPNVKTECQIN